MPAQLFDLNIQQFLDSWTPRDAVRELLANALDEAMLSGTQTPAIERTGVGEWTISDAGRGLRPEHLALAESEEKTGSPLPVIGRFGVGLKDALATLHRHGVEVEITSRWAHYTLAMKPKHGFDGVQTLHVRVGPAAAPQASGTLIRLRGLADEVMQSARALFLAFSPQQELSRGPMGSILTRRPGRPAEIYVRGVFVATEENFLFSYNITSLTRAMKDALNRERANVGRTAYADRVKKLLLDTREPAVAEELAGDLAAWSDGKSHNEVRDWSEVAVHACRLLNQRGDVLFVDTGQLGSELSALDQARSDGLRIIAIPSEILARLRGVKDLDRRPVRTLAVAVQEWNRSFTFDFVEEGALTPTERDVWSYRDRIIGALGGLPRPVREIRVSNTMRPELGHADEVVGLWEPSLGRVTVKRSQLRDLAYFAGTLAHELAHARSGRPDVDRAFERQLTSSLGAALAQILRPQPSR